MLTFDFGGDLDLDVAAGAGRAGGGHSGRRDTGGLQSRPRLTSGGTSGGGCWISGQQCSLGRLNSVRSGIGDFLCKIAISGGRWKENINIFSCKLLK